MSDAVNKVHSDSDIETKSYSELHRPASEFASRSDYLDHETANHETAPFRFEPSWS